MRTKCVVVLILMCVISMLAAEQVTPLKVIYQDSKHIRLKLTTPSIDIKGIDGSEFKSIDMEGSQPMAETGFPELPMYSTLLAIPATGGFTISVQEGTYYSKSNVLPKPVFSTDEEELLKSYNTEAYTSRSEYPSRTYGNSEAQLLRDFRVVQLSLFPVKYTAANKEIRVCREITVEITMNDLPGENEIPAYSGYSPAFSNIYESLISNFSTYRDPTMAPANPRILLIHGNSTDATFLAKLNEFVKWKRQKGFEVNVAGTALIGSTSNTGIKNYIQNQYNNLSTRPDFIILMGDTDGSFPIPAWQESMSSYGGSGDYPYTHLAGSDLLGDVFIGRISATNVNELDVIINKIYSVEKNINTTGVGANWLNRILLVGDPSQSGISTQYVNKFIKELALVHNPSYSFIENYSSGFPSTINSGITQGVGFFNYRGYIGMSSWAPSSSLTNGFKLPHATILTCNTGSYANNTSTTEALIRLGSSAVPAGSVTAIGMATSGTHTMFNNCLNAGIYEGIFTHGMRTMGEAALNGKLYIKQIYAATHDNQANYFSHWCNLMGDPTVEVFTGIPKTLSMIAAESLPMGTNVLDLQVIDELGMPVENVCVTAYSSSFDAVIGKSFTNSEGYATLNLSGGLQNQVILTASAHECKPVQQTLSVNSTGSLVYFSKQLIDNGTIGSIGNGDSFANAGETIALNLELKNTTANPINDISAILSCDDPYISIISNQISFNNMNAGQTMFGNAPFLISPANNIPPEHDVRFNVQLTDGLNVTYSIVFHIATYNARLLVNNYVVTAGSDTTLDPGETGSLQVWIKNSSISAVFDLNAELSSLNDLIVVTDSMSYIGAISGSMIGVSMDGFELDARVQLIPGMQMPMRLRIYNDAGFEQNVDFNISIGHVYSYTPLGPDAYGYFIYDNTDTAFADCPTFEWIELTPALGGTGTLITGFNDAGDTNDEGDQNGAITLKVLDIPFPFSFYGETYNQLTVCVNGFIALGVTGNGEFRNYHLPGGYGPSPMIAAFWDDLVLIGDAGIYQYYDSASHRYIIQYNKMRNGYNRTSLETFQIIFYDPMFYPTSMGDGMIKIQYKDFNNVDVGGSDYTPRHGNYASIGIKDHTNTRGLEYSYNNTYPHAAAALGNNKALLITTMPVLHQSAYLTMQELIVNDGNNNNIAEPGEALELGIKLSNVGINAAQQVHLTVSTTSSYASFSIAESNYEDIQGSDSGINRTPLLLQVSPECPNDVTIPISCNVTIAGNSWQFLLSIVVRKPSINVGGIYVNDSSGNNNGLVEAGETIELIVNMANNTSLEAKNIITNLSSESTSVNITNSTIHLPGVPTQSICQAVYHIEVSPDVPSGSNINFNLAFWGEMIPIQNEQIVIGIGASGMYENFESDNGSYIASPATNGWEWGTSAQGAHSGANVWGTRLNTQYASNANYTLTTPSMLIGPNFVLEFWHKYSTESTYDGGQVRISINNSSTWTLINPVGGYPSLQYRL